MTPYIPMNIRTIKSIAFYCSISKPLGLHFFPSYCRKARVYFFRIYIYIYHLFLYDLGGHNKCCCEVSRVEYVCIGKKVQSHYRSAMIQSSFRVFPCRITLLDSLLDSQKDLVLYSNIRLGTK